MDSSSSISYVSTTHINFFYYSYFVCIVTVGSLSLPLLYIKFSKRVHKNLFARSLSFITTAEILKFNVQLVMSVAGDCM